MKEITFFLGVFNLCACPNNNQNNSFEDQKIIDEEKGLGAKTRNQNSIRLILFFCLLEVGMD